MPKEQKPEAVANIIETLIVMNRGNFIIECGREMQELTDAIIDTGGKGSLVIKLEVTPSGLKDGRISQVDISPSIDIKKPKHDQGKSIFFVTADNKLVRDDPDQENFEFAEKERETNGRR
jgi:hypothetical protein